MFTEYTKYDALGLAELIKNKEVTAEEVLQAAIDQVDKLNPYLNAVIHHDGEQARKIINDQKKEGLFSGVPFLIKDLTAVLKDVPMTMGSRGINWVPDYDSVHVERWKSTGVSILGKTNTPELGLIITTEPKAHGPCHNPHKQGYSTGGSSGGSACAVASGMVPIASGGDGGGSIRFPSSWCGVFGLKPSRGLNPLQPDYGQAWSGAVADHILSRTVRDSAAMLDATAGYASGGPYKVDKDRSGYLNAASKDPVKLRIGLSRIPLIEGTPLDLEVMDVLDQTAKTLQDMGHIVEECEPQINKDLFWRDFITVISGHVARDYDYLKEKFGNDAVKKLEPATINSAKFGKALTVNQFLEALEGWHKSSMVMGDYLSEYNMMLCPTTPITATKHGVLPMSAFEEKLMLANASLAFTGVNKLLWKSSFLEHFMLPILSKMCYTVLGNVTGLPCMSVPLAMSSEGLPIGMQFVGRMGDEARLFSLAGQMERAGLFSCSTVAV